MIQIGTNLNVIDNCGAKKAYCIKIIQGFKKRYAFLGDIILVAIKTIRKRRKMQSKVKKGEMYRALIVRTKTKNFYSYRDQISFFENSVVLINKQNKFLGTRVFGPIPNKLRYTKYMRLLFMSAGTLS
jgi:large subunit ribosomal protein L14